MYDSGSIVSVSKYPEADDLTQLRDEGWLHHLARHAVACFLTRGDLYISWEEGAVRCFVDVVHM